MKNRAYSLMEVIAIAAIAFGIGGLVISKAYVEPELKTAKLEQMNAFVDSRSAYLHSKDGLREMAPKLRDAAINNPNDMTFAAWIYTEEALTDRAERAAVNCKSASNKACVEKAMNGNI